MCIDGAFMGRSTPTTAFDGAIIPGAKYIEKYSNTLQLLSLINDYNYITITGPAEM